MSRFFGRRWVYVLLTLVVAAFTISPRTSGQPRVARAAPPSPTYAITVRATTPQERTALLRAGFDIARVDVQAGYVVLFATTDEWSALQRGGWPILDVRPLAFPPRDARYHDYAETVAEIQAIARAYPDIARVEVYGRSVEGRDLYVVKISDHVNQDESANEPGVLIFANIHAREHLTAEQALWIIHHLTENYGRDPAVTNLVNEREIWIMPMTNPDGVEYDISKTGVYRWWRKNRRRNPDGSFGVDLNRNFGYKWGCCGGSSGAPYFDTYRGPAPFSEPETRAIRDFFLAHPSIRISLNFHSYSELVLWPYGYTYDPLPPDMDPTDYEVMRRAGTRMARLSGYTPMQASRLYIADGTSDDWVYGVLRIPTWTVELYPTRDDPAAFYPPDEVIETQVTRNREMVEYLIALADEPRKVLGLAGDLITPTVSITVSQPVVSTPLTVTVTVTDNAGATTVAIQEENTPLALTTPSPISGIVHYTFTLSLSQGEHVLTALAYDRAHNLGMSTPITVTVTTPPPPAARTWLPWLAGPPVGGR